MTQNKRYQEWRRVFFGVRTSILVWYVLLMAASALVSILTTRQVLFTRLEVRVQKSLIQEIQEFRVLTQNGRNPETGKSFDNDIGSIFKVFLNRNIPDDSEFLLTILNGELYKTSPRALPAPLKPGSDLLKYLVRLNRAKQGEKDTPIGKIRYITEPVNQGNNRGLFIVAHLTTGERREVEDAIFVVIQVTIIVIVVTSALAWLAAGRVVDPLRLLTDTARSISNSDFTQRIPITGADDIAELGIAFNEMLDRLQAAFASQRNFINDAGHELRTPITIIRGHLELLGDDPEERRETLALVTDELDRMSRFVDDLLLLAKAEQPNFLKLETLDLGLLIEEIYHKATALASDRQWRIERKGSGKLVADRQRLTQAILNLAQNATQHTQAGDAIALGASLKQGRVCFWVRDTGEGIPLADKERIFERFARAANNQRRSEGAGLGLAIVQAIAGAHGGKVELFSQLGRGSTFTIVIPRKPLKEVLSHEQDSNSRR